ncbi:MAG: hypothetical protein HY905_25020 [Deltaproteobacteria bacterium]|nr:hypothetical protein [Deltaproteobacteria bacterium]
MAENMAAPELRLSIQYEISADEGSDAPVVRSAVLRRLGSVGLVVQDDQPPKVGERVTVALSTPDGTLRFGAQVIVRLRGPGAAPWGFGAQIADVDEALAGRLLAVRLAAGQPLAAAVQ